MAENKKVVNDPFKHKLVEDLDDTWPVGNLGGISLVKRQGRETTREIKTPRQSRLIFNDYWR